MFRKMICLVSFVLVAVVCLACSTVAQAQLPEPVSLWRFQEGSGNTTADIGTGGNPGTMVGNVAFVKDAERGSVLEFGTGDSYVETNAWICELGGADFSIAAWIKTSLEGVTILSKSSADKNWGSHEKKLYVSAGGEVPAKLVALVGWGCGFIAGNIVVTDDKWHHICVTWDNNTNEEHIYTDGVVDDGVGFVGGLNNIYFNGGEDNPDDVVRIGFGCGGENVTDFEGRMDDVAIFDVTLTPEQVAEVIIGFSPELASNPSPANEATDVVREVVLSWEPGEFAAPTNGHKVYLGESFDDVNDAVGVVAQTAASYAPAQRLDFGTTYYWRVDEVNAPPTSHIEFKGGVWQFTTEPIGYPIENVTATASSSLPDTGPENVVNGSGLDADDLHSIEQTDMWISDNEPNEAWIEFEFNKVYKLHEMWVWNSNQFVEPAVGYGCKDVSIEYSVDGNDYTALGTIHEFAQALGTPDYTHNTTINFGGVVAKKVRLTISSNWGGILQQYSLSEVRFTYIPVRAREPNPDSGATDVDVDLVLSFRAGREAAEHNVYISTDEQAVIDGNAPVTTVTETGYGPLSLDLDTTYYWKINEVNDAETTTTWQGDIWNFTTPEYLVVDDFELYNDIPDGEEGSNLVYLTWIDGYENPSVNGSTMGHTVAFEPSMESVNVYDGGQSAPLYYDNSTASYSEATANVADLQVGQDWTRHGIKALTLMFLGDPNNAVQQMYVKVNGSKVTYEGDAENIRRTAWQMWYIDLASLGVSLSNVTELSIGFERSGAVGGQGVVYFDGIRLYSHERQLITPVEPKTAGLVGHWKLDEVSGLTAIDSSGSGNNGTLTKMIGNEWTTTGILNGALGFDGINDYIEVPDSPSLDITDAITIAAWVKPQSTGTFRWLVGKESWGAAETYGLDFTNDGEVEFAMSTGTMWIYRTVRGEATQTVSNGIWSHVVGQYSPPYIKIFINGQLSREWDIGLHSINTNDNNLLIAKELKGGSFYSGLADDIRIYDRALTQGEVAWLAGRTEPFDKPF